jgi:hypothetical protein
VEAARHNFRDGQPVRLTSYHGAVVGNVSYNDRIPCGAAFIDFVPGEINRLTDYLDAFFMDLTNRDRWASYVEWNNFGSLRSCYRMGYTDFGNIVAARIWDKPFGFRLEWVRP